MQQRQWNEILETENFKLKVYYGFHLFKIENFIGHDGNIVGYNSFMVYEACTNTTLIIIVNVDSTKSGLPPADIIAEYIIARLNNKAKFSDIQIILGHSDK